MASAWHRNMLKPRDRRARRALGRLTDENRALPDLSDLAGFDFAQSRGERGTRASTEQQFAFRRSADASGQPPAYSAAFHHAVYKLHGREVRLDSDKSDMGREAGTAIPRARGFSACALARSARLESPS